MEHEKINELFLEVYKNSYKKILNFVFYIIKNRSDAEDITQETFYKAYNNMSKIRDLNKIDGWLKKIALHAAIDFKRNKNSNIECRYIDEFYYENFTTTKYISLNNTVDDNMKTEILEREIKNLSIPLKGIIAMRFYKGYTFPKIAEEMNININTVFTRYRKAKEMIKERCELLMKKEGYELLMEADKNDKKNK